MGRTRERLNVAQSDRPSKSAVTNAGDLLRRHRRGDGGIDPFTLHSAYETLSAFRREWVRPPQPLVGTNMGLRSMLLRVVPGADPPTQRLKREDRIIQKLVRQPSLRLAQMQDIGGCRVVVPTLAELRRVCERIEHTWAADIAVIHDRIAKPQPTGYRAIHIIVSRHDRLVEVQLRTELQHRWARAVELAEQRTGDLLKDGVGDVDLIAWYRDLATAYAYQDRGEPVPTDLEARLGTS
jgi:putative GTP pyrophosphokinase